MAKASVKIPARLVPKLEQWGKLTAEIFGEIRQEEGLAPEGVPKDQLWFWSKEWQAKEKEADQAEANGDYVEFEDVDEAINYLNNL